MSEWSELVRGLETGVETECRRRGDRAARDRGPPHGRAVAPRCPADGHDRRAAPAGDPSGGREPMGPGRQLSPASPGDGGAPLVMADEISVPRLGALRPDRRGAQGHAATRSRWSWSERTRRPRVPVPPGGVVPVDDASPVRNHDPGPLADRRRRPAGSAGEPQAVPSQEPNSKVVVMPAQEHVVGHLGCAALIAAFVDAGRADRLDGSCMAKGADPSPSFRLP